MTNPLALSPDVLISDEADPVKRAQRFEEFKALLDDEARQSFAGITQINPALTGAAAGIGRAATGGLLVPEGRVITKVASFDQDLETLVGRASLTKGLSAEVISSLQASLEQAKQTRADLTKDLTLTSPLATGFVPFDLEAPSKKLTPRPTPLRNRLPRLPGTGTSRRYKRILGFTGTGTGGVGLLRPGISDTSTATFGSSLVLNRGPKISYAADEKSIPYLQFSLSDSATWSAQFSGQGYEDIRQLSQTSVLYASMLAEERMILGGRGTATGFVGALAAPTVVSMTARAAAPGEVGLVAGRYWVKVTTEAMWGESVLSAVANVDGVTAGQVVDVVVTIPAGGLGQRVYAAQVAAAGADPGDTVRFFQGRSGYKTFTIGGAGNPLLTSGPTASGVTADTTASALDYDGILTYLGDPNQTGYSTRLDAPFSSANPGVEFQVAFASLYASVKASPQEILFNGLDRKQLSDLLKTSSSSNYRLTVLQGEVPGVVMGTVVTTIVNEVTGDDVKVTVHPWLNQGNCPIISWTLPIPDTQVSNVFEVHNVQDYMSVQWPTVQFSYDVSSYWYGVMTCYAPAWCGAIQGIKQV